MYCTKCGKELKEGALRCEFCNAVVESDDVENGNFKDISNHMNRFFDDIKEKGASATRTGIQMLKEEKGSTVRREFRIVDDKRYLVGIVMLSIFIILVNMMLVLTGRAGDDGMWIPKIIESMMAFYLLASLLSVKKTYLSDYIILFILLSILMSTNSLIKISSIRESYIVETSFMGTVRMIYAFIAIVPSFILSIITIALFFQIRKGKSRKRWLILVLLLMLCAEIGFWLSIMMLDGHIHIGLHFMSLISLLLFVLSISNSPNKVYASKTEPSGKHIKTRSIGFSVILSILTFGLYYYIVWTYCIISDIRKLEGKRGIALGEWLLYDIVPIYDLVWLYTRANKLSVIGANNKIKSNGGGGFFIFMHIIFLDVINMALIQSTLNDLARVMDGSFVYGTVIQQDYMKTAQTVASDINYIGKLNELNELRKAGIITEEEFADKKAHFLEKM